MSSVGTVYGSVARLLSRARMRHIAFVSAVLLLLTAGATAFFLTRPAEYTSTTLLALRPAHERIGASYLTLTTASYQRFLASHAVFTSTAVKTQISAEKVASATEVSVQPQTLLLHVRVTLPDPQEAATVSRAVAHAGVQHSREDKLVDVVLIAPAQPPERPTSPQRYAILVGGVLVGGGVLAVSSVLLATRLRARRVA